MEYFFSKQRLVACSCEHCNEQSPFLDVGEFLDQLSDCQLLKKDSAFRSELVSIILYRPVT
jgi:hypothetical protein